MSASPAAPSTPPQDAASPADTLAARFAQDPLPWLLKVAWFSILLGCLMQILTAVVVKLCAVDPNLKDFVRDLAQKVTWSTFVCVGLAVGQAIARARTAWVGFVGLLAAPAGFIVARAAQKSTAQAVGAAQPDEMGMAVFVTVLVLKAVEYGGLGTALAWLAARGRIGLRPYLMTGLTFGLMFGLAVVAVMYFMPAKPPPLPKLASLAVNEVLFPLGCSLVLCVTTNLALRAQGGARPAG
jgi:hypothetical protein